jgi:hypothetical protein
MSDSVSCTADAATRLLLLVSAVRAFSFVPLANLNGHGPTSGGVLSPGDLSRENIEAQGRRGRQTVAAPPAPPRPAVLRWRIRGLTAAERAIQNRVNNPFDDPSSEIATPFDDPTPTGGPLGPGGVRSGDRTRGPPGDDRGRLPPKLNPVPFPPF